MKFTELKLNEQLLEAISYMGFETVLPIQEKVIPLILENKDLIACIQFAKKVKSTKIRGV